MIRVLAFFAMLISLLAAAVPTEAAWPPEGNYLGYAYWAAQEFHLVSDGSGGVLAMWRKNTMSGIPAVAARSSGSGDVYWSDGAAGYSYPASYASPDGLGGMFFTGPSFSTNNWVLSHVVPGGGSDPAWPTCEIAPNFGGSYAVPCVQNDGTGGALVAFRPSTAPSSGTFVRRVLANGTLDPGWPAGGIQMGPTPPSSYPWAASVSDGAGGAIFFWRRRVQRVTATGTIAPGWPTDGLILSTGNLGWGGYGYDLLALAPSGPDHFFACWTEDSGDVAWSQRIVLQRFHRDGSIAVGWPTNAMVVSKFSPPPQWPMDDARMISDGSTGAYVAWLTTAPSVRGVRVLEDGSIANGWTGAGGLLLTGGVSPIDNRQSFDISTGVASGGASGLVTTWMSPQQVVSQWRLPDGSLDPHQPTFQVVNVDSPRAPATVSDGHGGIFVGWAQPNFPNSTKEEVMLSWMPHDSGVDGVTPVPHASAIALRAWPNPARNALEVSFSLPTASRASLELVDLTGRRVRHADSQGVGEHVSRFEHLEGVAPGIYWLRLAQGNAIRTARVAVVR